MSQEELYTARWYTKQILALPASDGPMKQAHELAQEQHNFLSLALGEKDPVPREDKDGKPAQGTPENSGKPTLPDFKNDPKHPHRYPLNTRYEADPDVGGFLNGGKPQAIVLHHTMSYNTEGTVSWFKQAAVDVHFVVGHNGEVVQMADCNRNCAHAGVSKWNGMNGLNSYAIGIEVVNIGPLVKKSDGTFIDGYGRKWNGAVRERNVLGYKYWEPFTSAQEQAVIQICLWAHKTYGIKIENMCAHYECSPGRKNDPAGGLAIGSMAEFRKYLQSLV